MDLHFRAFSFVDRIHSIGSDGQITGQYEIPPGLTRFSHSLVAESVGQLAAWASMKATGFTVRPVAGLASRVELVSPVQPGQQLDLTATIESVDQEAVAYSGSACVQGETVLRLHHCVGPMMPLSEFDDPQLVKHRFDLLKNEGAEPGAFGGVPDLCPDEHDLISDDSIQAIFRVPDQADFFADHFLLNPVLPGTLLTDVNLGLATELMDRTAPTPEGSRWLPKEVLDVKLRAFIPPGKTLELTARKTDSSDTKATIVMQIRQDGKRIGSCRVNLALEDKL
jgi:3-hydroxymyristoyl/3-hydroxydecanoyl-(acyl carrier protein) dehydratase